MKFSKENIRPGMKVKLKNERGICWVHNMDYLIGKTVRVVEVDDEGFKVDGWRLDYDDIEKIIYNNFTKDDLQNGDIVTDGEGDISVYFEGELIGNTIDLEDLNDNLKSKSGYDSNDIVKVERPSDLVTIWERQENEKVEMTIEEIEEKLGMEKGKLRVKGVKE